MYHKCGIENTLEHSQVGFLVTNFSIQLFFFGLRMSSLYIRSDKRWGLDDIFFLITSVSP